MEVRVLGRVGYSVVLSMLLLMGALIAIDPSVARAQGADDVLAASFTDVAPTHPYYDAIVEARERGLMEGYPDGSFRPDAPVLRAQFAKMVVNALGLPVTEGQTVPFPDLLPNSPTSLYPTDYAAVAYQNGITVGKGGNFQPYVDVSRAQLITMVVRAYQRLRPVVLKAPPSWFPSTFPTLMQPHKDNLRIADYNGLLVGVKTITDPWAAPSRGEIAAVLVNAIKVEESVQASSRLPAGDYDVIVYGNTIAAAGVVDAINKNDVTLPKMKVAILNFSEYREDAVSNGLGLEDMFGGEAYATGFYSLFRNAVRDHYLLRGIDPVRDTGRMTTEPEVAGAILDGLTNRPNVTIFQNVSLLEANDAEDDCFVQFRQGTATRTLRARALVDASVEADLARLLGADYRMGRGESLYNDVTGPKPARPSLQNDWNAPQALSQLLTLQVYPNGIAPRVRDLRHPLYDASSYNPLEFAGFQPSTFPLSWSMGIAILPYDKRELNERWTDYLDPDTSYDWFFGPPEQREDIRRRVTTRAINFLRYAQENGNPSVGIATVNPWLYVRGEVRVEGRDVYTKADIQARARREVVAVGFYSLYDRHDAHYGPSGSSAAGVVRVPMGVMMPNKGGSRLLVTNAISTDVNAYNSAVRMEHVRANLGYVAGALVFIAENRGIGPQKVNYSAVSALLKARGFRLE